MNGGSLKVNNMGRGWSSCRRRRLYSCQTAQIRNARSKRLRCHYIIYKSAPIWCQVDTAALDIILSKAPEPFRDAY